MKMKLWGSVSDPSFVALRSDMRGFVQISTSVQPLAIIFNMACSCGGRGTSSPSHSRLVSLLCSNACALEAGFVSGFGAMVAELMTVLRRVFCNVRISIITINLGSCTKIDGMCACI